MNRGKNLPYIIRFTKCKEVQTRHTKLKQFSALFAGPFYTHFPNLFFGFDTFIGTGSFQYSFRILNIQNYARFSDNHFSTSSISIPFLLA